MTDGKHGFTIEEYEPVYFGISEKATKASRALKDAMDKAVENREFWPCLNNPYFYMDYDANGFETEDGESIARYLTSDEAESLCHGCPLIKQCYDFAVASDFRFGIWGGIDFGASSDTLFPEGWEQ